MRSIVTRSLAAVLALALMVPAVRAIAAEAKQININTATADELATLKGIGVAKSQAIVEYREKHGPFKTVDDLKGVSGIGDKLLEQLRPNITAGPAPGGPATTSR